MKHHYRTAPTKVQRQLQSLVETGTHGGKPSPATGWQKLVSRATTLGYRVDVDDVPTPATKQLEELRKDTAVFMDQPLSLRQWLAGEARREGYVLNKVKALAVGWVNQPTLEEEAGANRARIAQELRAEAIEKRTQQLLAETQTKALAAARAKAIKEIEANEAAAKEAEVNHAA